MDKQYANSTLMSWKKEELVRYIRLLQHNVAAEIESGKNQYALLKEYSKRFSDEENREIAKSAGALTTTFCPDCVAKMDKE